MKLHDWVVVKYEFVLYPECIAQINGDEIEVICDAQGRRSFKAAKIFYMHKNIVKKMIKNMYNKHHTFLHNLH